MTTSNQRPSAVDGHDIIVAREVAEGVLRRAGFSAGDVTSILAGINFPAPLSVILLRGERFGISTGTLMERMGSSP